MRYPNNTLCHHHAHLLKLLRLAKQATAEESPGSILSQPGVSGWALRACPRLCLHWSPLSGTWAACSCCQNPPWVPAPSLDLGHCIRITVKDWFWIQIGRTFGIYCFWAIVHGCTGEYSVILSDWTVTSLFILAQLHTTLSFLQLHVDTSPRKMQAWVPKSHWKVRAIWLQPYRTCSYWWMHDSSSVNFT